jgi:hypothetical protein
LRTFKLHLLRSRRASLIVNHNGWDENRIHKVLRTPGRYKVVQQEPYTSLVYFHYALPTEVDR